ncbi:MAG TPA: MFS transporter [Acidimicrobiales bacterium]
MTEIVAAPSVPHRGVFAGWYVVAAAFVMLMTSAGLGFYGLAVYLEAVTREKGFATGPASLGSSLFFIVAGVVGRIIGPIIGRRDVRVVVGVGAVVSGIALALLGHVNELWQFYGVYAVFAVGFACTAIVPGTTVVTRWFHKRRSVALSVASTGLSVGGLTLTKLAASLIDSHGLSATTPWLGLAYVAIVVPVTALFMWPDPAARGMAPDGEPYVAPEGSTAAVAAGVTYDDAVASRFFKLVTVGFVFVMGSQVGGITQMVKLGAERVDRSTGALAVSVLALSSVVARLVGGLVASRVPMGVLTAALAAVQGLSLVYLGFADGKAALLGGAVLFGVTVGNLLMLQPLMLAEAFGVRDYPRVFSLNQLVVTVGIAGGPFLLGSLHDIASYRVAYTVAGVLSLAGAASVWSAGSVKKVQEELW